MRQALGHPSYVLLACGFFVCGFHIAFISTHLPAVPDATKASAGRWRRSALGLIGLFNVIGAYVPACSAARTAAG